MNKLSRKNNAIIIAIDKGYYLNEEGKLFNSRNKEVIGNIYNGYKHLSIRDNEGEVKIKFHRLQAYQKYKEKIFEKDIVVRHLNGNSLDNSSENIVIGSQSDNVMDMPKKIRLERAYYASSFTKKYNNNKIKEFYNECNSYKLTMEKFNITSKGTLHYILKN